MSLVRDLKSFAIHLHNVSFVSAEGAEEHPIHLQSGNWVSVQRAGENLC